MNSRVVRGDNLVRLLLFQAADHANITANGKLNVLGMFNEINPPSYPYVHPSMTLVVKFRVELGEHGQTRKMVVQFRKEDGDLILGIPHDIKIGELPVQGIARKMEINGLFQLNNIEFPAPGIYQFLVLIDKDQKGELAIYANEPPQK